MLQSFGSAAWHPRLTKSSATTRQICVTVRPIYLDEQSAPEDSHFFWVYHVVIENLGTETVRLLRRHWRVTEARGELVEVHGAGVVGEQPRFEPGDAFAYTSGVSLMTPSGIMSGSYRMQNESGESFDIEIPVFSLDSPHQAGALELNSAIHERPDARASRDAAPGIDSYAYRQS